MPFACPTHPAYSGGNGIGYPSRCFPFQEMGDGSHISHWSPVLQLSSLSLLPAPKGWESKSLITFSDVSVPFCLTYSSFETLVDLLYNDLYTVYSIRQNTHPQSLQDKLP